MPFQKTEATGRVDEAPGAAARSITSSSGMRPPEDTADSGNVVVQSPREATSKLSADPPNAVRRNAPSALSGGVAALTLTWRVTRMRRHALSKAPAACAPASAATAITACRPSGSSRMSLAGRSAPASGMRAWRHALKASAASLSEANCVCNASSASL
ncbi:hypothetical protein D3C85_794480 [compost metagenome]